jgi:pectinesterase
MLVAFTLTIALVVGGAAVPPDITVAADGSGDFKTVQEAVASIPRDNRERIVVLVKDGVYNEKIRVDANCVTLRGESRAGTRIEFPQLNDDFTARPDRIGRAVINLSGDDFVLENIAVANTAGVVGKHAFTIYGRGDRTVIVDADLLSDGADTLALWNGDRGRYYHARCNMRGAVDFVCPRGWCYLLDCTFYETKASAAMWHDGGKNQDQKFVIERCQFDGVPGWSLARHHHDGAFYFLDCKLSNTMIDRAPYRVVYPLGDSPATAADEAKNRELDKDNIWGERSYFYRCRRDSGDYTWMADNLATAPGSPKPAEIDAKWTFGGSWDPEATTGPRVVAVERDGEKYKLRFSEPVTVKGHPRLKLAGGAFAEYASSSGGGELTFAAQAGNTTAEVEAIDLNGGFILASQAAATLRQADLALPSSSARKLRIVLVGDSTVTDGSGWGAGFKKCLDGDVECINVAQNGRSSKSFRNEGRWEPVVNMNADYVLLQFGHNDQPGKGPERESPADTGYRANMRRYVEEARAAGAQPVLVTSLVRRKFGADGKVVSDLTEYVDVVKEVAAETNTPLVDLHALSIEQANSLGSEGCQEIDPVSNGKRDTTHLTAKGSEMVGKLVADELGRVMPALAPHLTVPADAVR